MSLLINPTTGEEIDHSPAPASLEEADAAIARAHDAFPAWRDIAPGERARLLRAFAAVVDAHLEELAQLEVLNAGHTIGNARWEAGNVRDCLNYYSAAPERLFGRQIPVAGGTDLTFHEPLGVVGIIVPWNFPVAIPLGMVAAGLSTGNTVVLKPAEQTPGCGLLLAEALHEAGLPPGVFNLLPGEGETGAALVAHPHVATIAFTGSVAVGLNIIESAAKVREGQTNVKRVISEMGGKNCVIVDSDADLDEVVPALVKSAFDYAGQKCSAASAV